MRACMNGSAHHFQLAVGLEVEELQPKRTGKRHPLPEGGQLGPVSSLRVLLAREVGSGLHLEHLSLNTLYIIVRNCATTDCNRRETTEWLERTHRVFAAAWAHATKYPLLRLFSSCHTRAAPLPTGRCRCGLRANKHVQIVRNVPTRTRAQQSLPAIETHIGISLFAPAVASP